MIFDPAQWLDDEGKPRLGAPLGMLLSAQAARRLAAPAFTCAGRTMSFAQLDRAANRMARALAAEGVGTGDCVVICLPNCLAFPQAVFALWKLGATPCPISNRLTQTEFSEILALARPRLVIGTGQTDAGTIEVFDIDGPLDDGLDDSPLAPAISTPGKMLGSGGSTGRPKLIVDARDSAWSAEKQSSYRPPFSTILNPGPLYHTAPFHFSIVSLAEGSHVVCMERFDARGWLDLVGHHQITVATMVPTMMSRISKLDPAITSAADLSSLQFIMHSSAPCPPDVKRWWLEQVDPAVLVEVYGGTERLGSTLINGTEWLQRPGSVGRAQPGDTIVILGEDGGPLPAGEVGEILFHRATGVGKSYRYIGAQSRIRGELDGMGDMGWLDPEGYLYIADRRTDLILVGGMNVYPAEIEAALESVAGVQCVAVIGLPDPDLGNRIHAIVELARDVPLPASEDALTFLEAGLARLAAFKRPRSAEFTYDRVRDDAGKVRRAALRAERIACAPGQKAPPPTQGQSTLAERDR